MVVSEFELIAVIVKFDNPKFFMGSNWALRTSPLLKEVPFKCREIKPSSP